MSSLKRKMEIEKIRKLIFEMINEDGLYPDPDTLYANQSYRAAKGMKPNTFDIGNLSRTSCSANNIPESLRGQINDINNTISNYISNACQNVYKREIEKDNKFEEQITSASSKFLALDESEADREIHAEYASFSKTYIDKIANNFKLEIKESDVLGGGPCKNIYFELTIPEIIEGSPDKLEYINKLRKDIGSGGFDNALDFYIDSVEKRWEKVFDKNTDTIVQAWSNDEVGPYLEREILGKSIDSPEASLVWALDLLSGGALTGINMKSELKKMGMSEKNIEGMMISFGFEFIDFWSSIAIMFGKGAISGVTSWAGLKALMGESISVALKSFAGVVWRGFLAISHYIIRYVIPLILLAVVMQSGTNILSERDVFKKLIKTYTSVIKKVLTSHFNKVKSISKNIIPEIKSNYTDYELIYEIVYSSLDTADIVNEIEKSLSEPDNQKTEDAPFSIGAAAYYSYWGTLARLVGDALNRTTELDDFEKEAIIKEYEKVSRTNGDFLREMGTNEIIAFLNNQETLKYFDFNEWYRKSDEVKEGNMFSQREAQFLNDVFNVTNIDVGQKAGKEKGKARYLDTIIGSLPGAIKTMVAMSTMSAIVSMSIDSDVGPSGLENIDKMLKNLQNKALNLSASSIPSDMPLNLLYDIFESFDFSKEVPNVKIKKNIYQETMQSWNISNINMSNYENPSENNDHLFPLVIKKIAIG